MTDLLKYLGAADVDFEEVHLLLSDHFTRAEMHNKIITYMRNIGERALILKFDGERLCSVEEGPDIQPGDLRVIKKKIQEQIIQSGPMNVARRVMFSIVPTTGFFRWANNLQILPVPDHAPRPEWSIFQLHPFLIEATFPSSVSPSINFKRADRRIREVDLLLAPLNVRAWRLNTSRTEAQWCHETKENGQAAYRTLQLGYGYEGFQPIYRDFSDLSGIESMAIVPSHVYYGRYNFSIGDRQDVPDNLIHMLQRQVDLLGREREQFLRAAYWLKQAGILRNHSHSSAYVALVSAIECLLPKAKTKETNLQRRKNLPGPTEEFQAFLKRHLPADSTSNKARRDFYDIRSRLAHGDRIFEIDLSDFIFTIGSMKERYDIDVLRRAVSWAMRDWLESH